MKIRWSRNSLRLRITPRELQALQNDETVTEELVIPGGGSWSAEIRPRSAESTLSLDQGKLCFLLSAADLQKLSESNAEGVYLHWQDQTDLLYFIEKDFPCAHPRVGDAREPATETFKPTPDFEARKLKETPA
jgi:hypothetical protein